LARCQYNVTGWSVVLISACWHFKNKPA